MGFGDIVGLVFGGGATGLIGTALNRYFDLKAAQQNTILAEAKYKHEREVKEIDFKIMQVEWEGRNQVAVTEADGRSDVADSNAFVASFQLEPKQYANPSKFSRTQNAWMVFVDGARGLIRPGLTLYLCIVATAVWLQTGAILKTQPVPIDDAVNIYQQTTATILYLAVTCVTWWFGSRTREYKPKR